MKHAFKSIAAYLELCKLKIAMFAAFSSATGFLMSAHELRPQILLLILGVFILASGAGALNQYQERDVDALMRRTEKRPLPSGRIKPGRALCFSILLITLGSTTLFQAGGIKVVMLGLSAILWYNGVYTHLKRKTTFAAVPGALVGVIPPALGSIAGGGHFGNPAVLFLCFFLFMWQVPHFWLLIVDHRDDYRRAGLPSLSGIFTSAQFVRVIFIWIAATAASCLLIAAASTRTGFSPVIHFFIFALSLRLILSGVGLLRRRKESSFSTAFKKINLYMIFVIALFSLDRLL